jgi:hypothetical protein
MGKLVRKMDEMEMSINLKSVRIAWVYGLIFLLIWVISEYITTQNLPFLPFILMVSQSAIYWACQLIIGGRMAGKDEKQD